MNSILTVIHTLLQTYSETQIAAIVVYQDMY